MAKRDWASHAVLGDVKPLGTEVSLPILLLMPMLYLGGINDVQYIQGAVCAAVLLSYVERFLTKSSKKKRIALMVKFSSSSSETILYP